MKAAEQGLRRRMVRMAAGWAVLAACGGCVTISPDAVELLTTADRSYKSNKWVSAEEQAAQFIQRYGDSPVVAEAYFIRGMAHYKQQEYGPAEADFNKALAESKRPDLTAKAHEMLGHLAMNRNDPDKAVEHYAVAIRDLPEKPGKDETYYRYGLALLRTGKWNDARFYLARVINSYPHSGYQELAKRWLSWPGQFLSIQAGFYRQQKFAAQQTERLRAAGLDARHTMGMVGREPGYVVYVGRYPAYRDAMGDLGRVRVLVPDALIVP